MPMKTSLKTGSGKPIMKSRLLLNRLINPEVPDTIEEVNRSVKIHIKVYTDRKEILRNLIHEAIY
jgi:hypothetical protein